MAENSKIQWTHHTFNPWRGCARVSPGCVHCYAETLSKRNPKTLGTWGVDGARVVASPSMWQQPVKWDIAAARAGERHRVFCASLADVGEDRPDLVEPRKRLCDVIFRTPNLDWLLLTKRPQNTAQLFPVDILKRCWIGSTAEDQQRYDERIGPLLRTQAAVHFLSMEPLLSAVDMRMGGMSLPDYAPHNPLPPLDWVIIGGESGGGARRFDLDWARDIIRQCKRERVPVFVKQMGAAPDGWWTNELGPRFNRHALELDPRHGGNPAEWPEDLRIRQFPVVGYHGNPAATSGIGATRSAAPK